MFHGMANLPQLIPLIKINFVELTYLRLSTQCKETRHRRKPPSLSMWGNSMNDRFSPCIAKKNCKQRFSVVEN